MQSIQLAKWRGAPASRLFSCEGTIALDDHEHDHERNYAMFSRDNQPTPDTAFVTEDELLRSAFPLDALLADLGAPLDLIEDVALPCIIDLGDHTSEEG